MRSKHFYLAALLILLSFGCKKEENINPVVVQEPTKWELIPGHYNVYDTLGAFLYEMDIIPVQAGTQIDSFRFENFDGNFNFTTYQSSPANYPWNISIGSHDTLYDQNQNRWKIHSYLSENYNQYSNDTIRLHFEKTNINYYLEDLVPYYFCDCKQIAVKQN